MPELPIVGDSGSVPLHPEEFEPGAVIEGSPRMQYHELYASPDGRSSSGVWSVTPGVFHDLMEGDETFVVLAGHATITPEDGSPPFDIEAGDVCVFPAAYRSVWNVHETIMKGYQLAAPPLQAIEAGEVETIPADEVLAQLRARVGDPKERAPVFRPMRRKKQLLPEAEAIAMLESCTHGVLAVQGDDDYPYAVPLSYAYEDGKLYFHAAKAGHKLDAIARNEKASFCVIAADDIVPEKFTTYFRSAIAFGRARIVTDDDEKRRALMLLAEKYSPDHLDAAPAEIDGDWKRTSVIALAIEHLTGKASIELVKKRQ